MRININAYIPGSTPVHTCDARTKIVLLIAYAITLFLVFTWVGLGLCALAFVIVAILSRVSARRYFGLLLPVYVIVAFTILFNSFTFDVNQVSSVVYTGWGNVSTGIFDSMSPIALIGSFGFVPAGCARGCFFAIRIILLVVASLVVTYTTTSTELTNALGYFLKPLRHLHVPVDDIATVFSLALRFIPVTADEIGRVHDAQMARGASFGNGSLWKRIIAWRTVFIPLFVGLFRRADALAIAMDARCYGIAGVCRTSLHVRRFPPASIATLCVGIALCVLLAWLL